MNHSKRPLKYLGGASLLALSATFWLSRSAPPAAPPVRETAPAVAHARTPAPSPAAAPAGVEGKVAAAPVEPAPAPAPDALARKKALVAPAEASRIAEREGKLDKLDWNAPRPAAPPEREGPEPVGKREAAMAPTEKLAETEIMIARLGERRAALEARMREISAQGAQQADTFLSDRLEQRVARLEETARSLRDKE